MWFLRQAALVAISKVRSGGTLSSMIVEWWAIELSLSRFFVKLKTRPITEFSQDKLLFLTFVLF